MNLAQTKALMTLHNIRPTRSLGQNFLVDERVVSRIADLAALDASDLVLEIGPGLGHLTVELARRAGLVVAIEIDRHILPALEANLSGFANVKVIHGDALQINLRDVLAATGQPVKVVANLPYYVTTELLLKIMLEVPGFAGLFLMMQKEAAERIMAEVGTREYSPIGVIARSLGTMKRALTVGRGSFYPQPHVDSVILQLTPVIQPLVSPEELAGFASFLQNCFRQRRKTLINSFVLPAGLKLLADQGFKLESLLDQMGLSRTVRAEALSPAQFAILYHSILDIQSTV
jgi:16S rRNA (adenine1518-N6/adenine1519-N6)-dimethyltransferase